MDKTHEIEGDLTYKITTLIISGGTATHERMIAAMAATANVLAILAINTVGKDKAPEVISDMVNKAIETTNRCKEGMGKDNDT